MKRALLISYLLLCLYSVCLARKVTVHISNQFHVPLEGAAVQSHKRGAFTFSNEIGECTIEVADQFQDSIRIVLMGYSPLTVPIQEGEDFKKIKLSPAFINLQQVTINPRIDALNLFSNVDMRVDKVNSSQELLTKVPGLFIAQHAGGGKAEQLFLRGFDIDHGTDISISVNDVPTNMVSHAHGQGYADLHYVIPEIVGHINFGKGPYDPEQGNFATAGNVQLKTKRRLDHSRFQLETGRFGTHRMLGLLNLRNTKKQSAYIASEYVRSDGPFLSPQRLQRWNAFAHFESLFNRQKDRVEINASHFGSTWYASGQIPERAVRSGSISRFGAIDDTEGGTTHRSELDLKLTHYISADRYIKNGFYLTSYDFDLYSNFTFFLNNPEDGDQIRQKESRKLMGGYSKYVTLNSLGTGKLKSTYGVTIRQDWSNNNYLASTKNRSELLKYQQRGNIKESNASFFTSQEYTISQWTIAPGLRWDYFRFVYDNQLNTNADGKHGEQVISPKLNILFQENNNCQFYLKSGFGFHTNDTRVAIEASGRSIPKSFGNDLGTIWRLDKQTVISLGTWQLYQEEELVYVGDEGIVEPSGPSQRFGFDLSVRREWKEWFTFQFDLNYTRARSIGVGEQFIPLAPWLTSRGGMYFNHPSGISAGVQFRSIADRPADEANQLIAKGYFITDLSITYDYKRMSVSLSIDNLLNSAWNETQFATESRLFDEEEPTEEIHFTPGTPFFAKIGVAYSF